ncbi:MAG: glutamine synthetase III [Oscillospiraceae bacterium]
MNFLDEFGCQVFNDTVMRRVLSPEIYERLRLTRREGKRLSDTVAQPVASAMLEWALGQGATHYVHWFMPMTDTAVGKSESFLMPGPDGKALAEFSSRALVQGEPDASSFPSGGIRNTFEARGYTAWDPTSPVFVKDRILYIPTAFCSPSGDALDHKTPLLRAMDALSAQAVRVLRLLGDGETQRVIPQVGAEQEYFLVDRALYEQRLDLKLCGRTLLGAPPPKTQELDDHYYGRVRIRVAAFMHELDETLWRLGVAAKTKHNEVAPTQHELACVYDSANVTCDNNQLVMETMKVVAKRQNLACLLHEKPFARVNGSGKHNNFSLSTDKGHNLLSPGASPENNLVFLLFLAAFVRGVDRYGAQLRLSTATPNNDHRLGGFEAPPAMISMFLGDRFANMLRHCGDPCSPPAESHVKTGVATMPEVLGDDSDRNRTSPFAFTGNKFEFRMVGSSQSVALANTTLCAILADSLDFFASSLEQTDNITATVHQLCRQTAEQHGRILFNGNNYSPEWVAEAKRRGLPIITNALDAIEVWNDPATRDLFGRFSILSERECRSRYDVMMENYRKIILIEASTLLEMMRRQVIPAVISAAGKSASCLAAIRSVGLNNSILFQHVERLNNAVTSLTEQSQALQRDVCALPCGEGENRYIRDIIRPDMERLRVLSDTTEQWMDGKDWPMPTYTDLMHRV